MQEQNRVIPPNIVFSDATIYANQGNVYALDATSGTIYHTYVFQGAAYHAVDHSVLYANTSTPFHTTVHAIRANNGDSLWLSTVEGQSVLSAPVVSEGTIYTTTVAPRRLYAFRATDGMLLWRYDHNRPANVFPSPTIVGDIVYISPQAFPPEPPFIFALSTKDGSLLWKSHITSSTIFPIAVVDNIICIAHTTGGCSALLVSDGTPIWHQPINYSACSSPTIADGKVYLGFSEPKRTMLHAFQAADGALLWKRQIEFSPERADFPPASPRFGMGNLTRPIVAHDRIYIGSSDGFLSALRTNDGTFLWRYQTGGKSVSMPSVTDDTVYVGADNGYVYAIRADDGALLWKTFVGTDVSVGVNVNIQPHKPK